MIKKIEEHSNDYNDYNEWCFVSRSIKLKKFSTVIGKKKIFNIGYIQKR